MKNNLPSLRFFFARLAGWLVAAFMLVALAPAWALTEADEKGVRAVVEEGVRLGLDQVTLYCLSVENWKRPPRELKFLLRLLRHFLVVERRELMEQDVRLAMIGRREGLPAEVLDELDRMMRKILPAAHYHAVQKVLSRGMEKLEAELAGAKLAGEAVSVSSSESGDEDGVVVESKKTQ